MDQAGLPEGEEIWFAILDDDNDMGDLNHALVRTRTDEGLTLNQVATVVYHLNEKWRDSR